MLVILAVGIQDDIVFKQLWTEPTILWQDGAYLWKNKRCSPRVVYIGNNPNLELPHLLDILEMDKKGCTKSQIEHQMILPDDFTR